MLQLLRDEAGSPTFSPDKTPKGDEMQRETRGRRAIGSVSPTAVGALLERGVWTAPFLGPRGEPVLVAVDRDHRKIIEIVVPAGIGLVDVSDDLWALLDRADPEPEPLPFTLTCGGVGRPVLTVER